MRRRIVFMLHRQRWEDVVAIVILAILAVVFPIGLFGWALWYTLNTTPDSGGLTSWDFYGDSSSTVLSRFHTRRSSTIEGNAVSHDGWLERPYDDAAESSEQDEVAHEHGFDSWEDYVADLESERADVLFERQRERQLFGED